jgi:hypothetical protein
MYGVLQFLGCIGEFLLEFGKLNFYAGNLHSSQLRVGPFLTATDEAKNQEN